MIKLAPLEEIDSPERCHFVVDRYGESWFLVDFNKPDREPYWWKKCGEDCVECGLSIKRLKGKGIITASIEKIK